MENDPLQLQIQLLEHRIYSEETKYKEAILLHKDYNTLRQMRENIRALKQQLTELKEKA